jgi:hypothetical protein
MGRNIPPNDKRVTDGRKCLSPIAFGADLSERPGADRHAAIPGKIGRNTQENASLHLAQSFLAQASSAASRLTASIYLPRMAVLNTPVTKTIANAAKWSRGVALLLIM